MKLEIENMRVEAGGVFGICSGCDGSVKVLLLALHTDRLEHSPVVCAQDPDNLSVLRPVCLEEDNNLVVNDNVLCRVPCEATALSFIDECNNRLKGGDYIRTLYTSDVEQMQELLVATNEIYRNKTARSLY